MIDKQRVCGAEKRENEGEMEKEKIGGDFPRQANLSSSIFLIKTCLACVRGNCNARAPSGDDCSKCQLSKFKSQDISLNAFTLSCWKKK